MEDNQIAWGTPTLQEIKDYFAKPPQNVNEDSVTVPLIKPKENHDITDSFKRLLADRRRLIEEEKSIESGPKTPVSSKKTPSDKVWQPLVARLEDTVFGRPDWEPSDESFLRMEEKCEESQESEALSRLLCELGDNAEGKTKTLMSKTINEMTQLHDIEAPSMMWEQTLLHANSPKTTPIKMVGFLRPSTIIEESTVSSATASENSSPFEEDSLEQEAEKSVEKENTVVSVESSINETFVTVAVDSANSTEFETAISMASTIDSGIFPKMKRTFLKDDFVRTSSAILKKECSGKPSNSSDTDVLEVSDDSFACSKGESNIENEVPNFNNTFEMMEYMLDQAKKQNMTAHQNIPKQEAKCVSSTNSKPVTPALFKKPTLPRIPQPVNSAKSTKFSHIKSPIQVYIRNTPVTPTFQRHQVQKDSRLMDEVEIRSKRETQFFQKPAQMGTSLPRVALTHASSHRYVDSRTPQKIPGGSKVEALVSNANLLVMKHERRLKMDEGIKKLNNVNDSIDNSLADLSLASGNVSVCVLKDVKRV